eukprot:TRINITY_DN3557_c0_g1_i4.p1 TRINITY_DN3557_c0_g1~~TRINITY_DN3557_c0_g1_i4.p1  ORF type:complete len:197 (+),score=17.94 TRINITY_DN3557_c0_g1_i4:374-964(+)
MNGCSVMYCIKCGDTFHWECGNIITHDHRHSCEGGTPARTIELRGQEGLRLDEEQLDGLNIDTVVETMNQVLQFRREIHRLKKLFGKVQLLLPRCPSHSAQEVEGILLFVIELVFIYSNCDLYFTFKQPSKDTLNHFLKTRLASRTLFSLFDARPNFVCITRQDLDASLVECKSHLVEFLNMLKSESENIQLFNRN